MFDIHADLQRRRDAVHEKPADPYSQMAVIKNSAGEEVGRIAVAAKGKDQYIDQLGKEHGSLSISFETNHAQAIASQAVRSHVRES